ncbi:MAG: PqqD family protein [Oscillospiraceae bacterium]|nr:PqqD family protein [Oscillospiraceae bacterium]
MIRSEDFLLREVAGSQVLVPVGAATRDFAGIVTLNSVGVQLWDALETEQTKESLAKVLTDRYEVSAERAMADVEKFLQNLQEVGAVK